MGTSRSTRTAATLFLSTALTLTACGQQATGTSATGSTAGPARGDVEPDSHDGAPHYRENNGFKASKEMSPGSEETARKEAARIEPVLKRLWKAKVWDVKRVRAALVERGYRNVGSEQKLGTLAVLTMDSRFETDHYVTPEGAQIAFLVRADACVTAFTQPTNYQVAVNGPYLETGCFEPKGGH
ncbi:hypothetical protein [Streptomyces sp. NRRL B-1347]|uniref:hypothetical protein n=1 Tax=Streptomyces sp. NRRL B-1347 TaxID=1476877 RepID=UPI0004C94D22|nr:hypothetical protein [Streptomyces sp. NRRL B-1347]